MKLQEHGTLGTCKADQLTWLTKLLTVTLSAKNELVHRPI